MLEAGAVGAAWSAARGWLTPAVLFVLVNLVIGTIAVASRLMSPAPAPAGDESAGGERRSLLRAPSLAVDRLRASFSFSRLGLAADHAEVQPLTFDEAAPDPEPSPQPPPPPAAGIDREAEEEREQARIERSRSEAAAEAHARRRPRARRPRRTATAEEPARDAGAGAEETAPAAAVEVDERADDFIRRFREQLRLQRLESLLRYRDTLRRAGTA